MQKLMKSELKKRYKVLDFLTYNNGVLYWKFKHNKKIPDSLVAGHQEKRGYIKISFKGQKYLAHRLIWVIHFGEIPEGYVIDHINQNKKDNRIDNLRLVTFSENALNTNKTKGVRKHSSANKWQAYITIDGKYNHLGNFLDEKSALKARRFAEKSFTFPKSL